jgi:hypothetical protein
MADSSSITIHWVRLRSAPGRIHHQQPFLSHYELGTQIDFLANVRNKYKISIGQPCNIRLLRKKHNTISTLLALLTEARILCLDSL